MKQILTMIAALLVLAWPGSASAQIPVTDAGQIGQNVQQLAHQVMQITELRNQITELQNQLTQLEKQTEALTGNAGYGGLANSSTFKQLRRINHVGLDDMLNALEGGGGEVGQLGRELIYQYGLEEAEDLFAEDEANDTNPLIFAHNQGRRVVAASGGSVRALLAGADRRIDVYEGLIEQIDQTQTAKESADLAARIEAQNGLLMNDLIRLLALQVELQQTQLARDLANDQADGDFLFTEESG